MNDLRVRVFTHLQRLGLDYYTDEQAGVIMTRMTSDIEQPPAVAAGRARPARRPGPDDGRDHRDPVHAEREAGADHDRARDPGADRRVAVVPCGLRSVGYNRVRDGIANVLGDLSESLHGVRTVAAYNRQRWNIVQHRNVVGDYRDANNYTAQINAIYGPGTQMLGYLGQAALLAIGGNMVIHHQLSIGALVAFFLYLNRFLAPIQLLVQQYNTFQQGQAAVFKLRALFAIDPSTPEAPAAAGAAADRR